LLNKGIPSQIIEVDKLWEGNSINIDFALKEFYLLDKDKNIVYVDKLSLIWWRRSVRGQTYHGSEILEEHKQYLNAEFEASLFGILHAKFIGKWISDPFKTTFASNKIIQTLYARQVGFKLPRTLFSQDYNKIKDFLEEIDHQVIIKPIYGSTTIPLYTKKIDKSVLAIPEDLSVCPTIYQEYIPGRTHLRINVFGSKIYPFMIETDELDWRQNITIPITYGRISPELEIKIFTLLKLLNIQMGIFDFKIHELTGETFFFEVNPQGNFLFLEGVTNFPLADKFADYLIEEKATL
jgi:glutathione synthase/RimK-type ligase-like ATP-grasp enzyme